MAFYVRMNKDKRMTKRKVKTYIQLIEYCTQFKTKKQIIIIKMKIA